MALFPACNMALLFLFCLSLAPADVFPSDTAGKEQEAMIAAVHWLALVDQGDYTASWNEAAQSLRASEPRDAWVRLLHRDREPGGAVVSRTVKRSVYRIGPRGRENVDVYFETSFARMGSGVESVGTRREQDGHWRVTGYVVDSGKPGTESILMALLLAAAVVGIWVMEARSDPRLLSGARACSGPEQEGSQ